MATEKETESIRPAVNPFTAVDVEAILRQRGWLEGDVTPEIQDWLREAAALLGPQASAGSASSPDRFAALAELLRLIFVYDARTLMEDPDSRSVMVREGAREVIRGLANRVLDGPEIDSDRFKEIIDGMKASLRSQGRKLFHPIRLALAGRAGEGELDRVILLLDRAAKLSFRAPVKGTRQRIIEFCAALG